MTATDELRRLLDERGVEWTHPRSALGYDETDWDRGEWEFCAIEGAGGELDLTAEYASWCTPEQAIEATLGRRTTTRHGKWKTKYGRSVPCCECCGYGIGDTRWHYCPSCGAEVVE